MITVDKLSRNPRYLINERAISFTENYQGTNLKGNPIYDVVAVSIVSNAAIMVYDENNGIGWGEDLQYQRWHLNGDTTGLVSAEAHNIYARLSRGDKKEADIIFSVRNYNTDGSITRRDEEGDPVKDADGNVEYELEASDIYYYILIGTLTALTDTNGAPTRTLTFDPGYLSSQKSNNEQSGGWISEMFDLVRDAENLIRAKLRFEKLKVKGEAVFSSIASFFSGLKLGDNKPIVSVATGSDAKEDAADAIATPAYVKAFSEGRYLRYDIKDEQTVAGPVTFNKNVAVGGNQHIEGTQEVVCLQTLHEGFMTKNFNDVGGQIRGAQLTKDGVFTAAGLISMSFNVFELVYNKIRATGSKLALNATATIAGCRIVMKGGGELTPDEFYADDSNGVSNIDYALITFKEDETNGGLIPFENGDILYGYVNKIGESGQHARGGQCAMRIISSNEEIGNANVGGGYGKMTVRVQLYSDAITDEQGAADSAVGNMAPTEGMTLAHRGNTHNANRQASFFIDSQSGNIVMLDGVNSPAIGLENYAVVLGKCPSALYAIVKDVFTALKQTDPVVYARYAIFENFIQLDHQMKPIQRENNRGEWSAPATDDNGNQINPYTNDVSYYDVVTYQGSLYKCVDSGTTDVPGQGDGWLLLVAKGADGKDGNDTQPNLLANSNFDLLEEDGDTLKNWKKINLTDYAYTDPVTKSEYVTAATGLGTNAVYKTFKSNGELMASQQMVNLQPNIDYTLSVYTKYEGGYPNSAGGNLDNYGYGITFSGTGANKVKKISSTNVIHDNFGNASAYSAEIYLGVEWGNDKAWVKHSITFQVTEAIESIWLRFFVWSANNDEGTTYYYTQPKLEVGSVATSYCKNESDLNGQNGKNAGNTYELIPTPSSIVVDKDGTLSAKNIAIAVGQTTPDGYNRLTSNNDIARLGLSVEYSIDDGERIPLGSFSNGIPVSYGQKQITYYLKTSENVDIATKTVNIVYDGALMKFNNLINNSNFDRFAEDGKTLLYWSNVNTLLRIYQRDFHGCNSIGHPLMPDGILLEYQIVIDSNQDYVFSFYLSQGVRKGIHLSFTPSSGSVVSEPITLANKHDSLGNNKWGVYTENIAGYTERKYERVAFRIYGATSRCTLTIRFEMNDTSANQFFLAQPQFEGGTTPTPYTKSIVELTGPAGERGIEGPQGDAGPMGCPYGEWDEDTLYQKTEEITPIVYYDPNNNGKGGYYIPRVGVIPIGVPPTNTEYWRAFTEYKFLIAELFMASWAKFGSANGGVFWDRFLFSQDGIKENGDSGTYSNFAGVGSDMMVDYDAEKDEHYLTGKFMPNLLLDFMNGAVKCGRFSEPYMTAERGKNGDNKELNCTALNPYKNHNIVINSYIDEDDYRGNIIDDETWFRLRNGLTILPSYDGRWVEDGQHFSILCTPQIAGNNESGVSGFSAYGNAHNGKGCYNIYQLITTEEALATNPYDQTLTTARYEGNWFIWKGLRTKYLLLTPGIMLRLRLQRAWQNNSYGNYWHIENASDFTPINARLFVTTDTLVNNTQIKYEPTKAFSISFSASDAVAVRNLVTGVDADPNKSYRPIMLAPSNSCLPNAHTNLGRENLDIIYSQGNVNDTSSDEQIPPIRTLHNGDFKF